MFEVNLHLQGRSTMVELIEMQLSPGGEKKRKGEEKTTRRANVRRGGTILFIHSGAVLLDNMYFTQFIFYSSSNTLVAKLRVEILFLRR